VIGRFYGNDPVGFSNVHNFNRYAYANNNPHKYTDPDGREVYPIGTSEEIKTINKSLTTIANSNTESAARLSALRNSKNVHVVRFSESGETPNAKATGIRENQSNGIGTGSLTVVDPTKSVITTNKDGTKVTNSGLTILTHELLGHGTDIDKGQVDFSINKSTGETKVP